MKELAEPRRFGDAICNGAVFGFRTRAGNGMLAFGRPRYQVGPKEDAKAGRGLLCIRTPSPISIGLGKEIMCRRGIELRAEVGGDVEVAEDAFHKLEVRCSWSMHEETGLLNGVRQVGTRDSNVLQGTGQAAIESGIIE